ncbi:hypothetical protein BS50DRAFT_144924 [Corynespora cassiicola Philippines]|uniref:Uncharacterized protein n=1 Tax=Corynespora cassiicola Philippines TaxID=1448308 RepID=A0A2T2N9K9_CORCC|nr:hypothetical protein BS50DRAFT_144924 [Corynespora cassiicola Philippines]
MRMMIRIPRLIRLTRSLREDPTDMSVGINALLLAEELYQCQVDQMTQGVLCRHARHVPTMDGELVKHFPTSVGFTSFKVFEGLLRYCYCRVFVMGLCRALIRVFPCSQILIEADLVKEDLSSASSIVMAIQFAEKLQNPWPWGPMLTILPLQAAYGSWHRASKDAATFGWERGRACHMMEWCRAKSNEILGKWRGRAMQASELDALVASWEGGPIVSWMQRDIDL